jgi:hypothetical protein
MKKEKLVRIAKMLLIAIVAIILFVFVILPKLKDGNITTGKADEGISTDITFNASDYDNNKMVQDYSNPTDEERLAINKKYGMGHSYFDEEGLHLVDIADIYTYEEDKLITDKWPDHEFTNSIIKPDMEIREIIVAETYLKIYKKNVSKKEIEKYVKEIKKEYKYEITGGLPKSIYRACNEEEELVDVMWKNNEGCIEYRFK